MFGRGLAEGIRCGGGSSLHSCARAVMNCWPSRGAEPGTPSGDAWLWHCRSHEKGNHMQRRSASLALCCVVATMILVLFPIQSSAELLRSCGVPPPHPGERPPPGCELAKAQPAGSPCTCTGPEGQIVKGLVAAAACGIPPRQKGERPPPPCPLTEHLALGSPCTCTGPQGRTVSGRVIVRRR